MSGGARVLILEDEPFIMLDLEMAAEDQGCDVLSSGNCNSAMRQIEQAGDIDVAVLDVSLEAGETCLPVALELTRLGVPYLLHTGDLVQEDGTVNGLNAPVIAKPASAERVIDAALALAQGPDGSGRRSVAA